MKVVFAGSRDLELPSTEVGRILDMSGFEVTELLNGDCRTGVDRAAREWAEEAGMPISLFPADWETMGKSAGPIRNRRMAELCDAVIVVWDGRSRGSYNMLKEALRLRKPVLELVCRFGHRGKVVYRHNYPEYLNKQVADQFDRSKYNGRVRRKDHAGNPGEPGKTFHNLRGKRFRPSGS